MKKNIWLSQFFKVLVYDLSSNELRSKKNNTNQNVLYQALLDNDEKTVLNNFVFIQSKYYLKKTLVRKELNKNTNIKLIKSLDGVHLNHTDFDMFIKRSRFNIFDSDLVSKYYYTWFVNSVNSKMDSHVIGYFDGNKILGFATYSFVDEGLRVGLIGTFDKYHGRGIGKAIVNELEHLAILDNKKQIILSTQGSNIEALNFYISNGFKIYDIKHWYYGGGYLDSI